MVRDMSPAEDEDDDQLFSEQEALYPRPLPCRGDRVFRRCADPGGDRAWLQKTFPGSATYLSAYQSAAHVLFEEVRRHRREVASTAEGTIPVDPTHWLLYPIYFCYRHALELSLKELSRVQGAEAGVDIEAREEELSRCHDVLELWRPVAPWIRRLLGKRLQGEAAAFEQLIADISEQDFFADAGRYHIRKLPKKKLRVASRRAESFADCHPIDLDNVCETFDKMFNFIRWVWSRREEKFQRAEQERWWLERLYRQ